MVVLMHVDYRRYNKPNVVFPAVAITMLCLLGAFLMHDSHATHRWIKFGIFSFQPSEIAKPALVLFLAWFLQDRMQQIEDWRNTLLPAALPSLLFIVLILKEPDLGTALVCAVVTAMMLYLAGMEKKYFGYGACRRRAGALLDALPRAVAPRPHAGLSQSVEGPAGLRLSHHPIAHRRRHRRPARARLYGGTCRSSSICRSRTPISSSPILPRSLACWARCSIIALFVTLGYRGLRTASLSKDPFARFLAFGITATILIQAFFNVSVVLALVPTKGITLPFISYGGTSLFFTLASVGVLLNLSRETD